MAGMEIPVLLGIIEDVFSSWIYVSYNLSVIRELTYRSAHIMRKPTIILLLNRAVIMSKFSLLPHPKLSTLCVQNLTCLEALTLIVLVLLTI